MIHEQELEGALRAHLWDVPPPAERVWIGASERVGRTRQRRARIALPHGPRMWAPGSIAAGLVLAAGTLLFLQLQGASPAPDVAAPSHVVATSSPSPSASPPGSAPSPAPEARTIVVAQAGGADARSIGEALEQARSGDTILVRPPIDPTYGSYTEPGLTILTEVTIRGADEGRIRVDLARPAVPQYDDYFHALWMAAPRATIENLELRPSEGGAGADLTINGSLTLVGVTLRDIWVDAQRDPAALFIRDSDILESGVTAPGPFRLEGSNVIDSTIEAGAREGQLAVIRDNRFISRVAPGEDDCGYGAVTVRGEALVEENTFSGRGICVRADGVGSVLRGNGISGARTAIQVEGASDVVIEANELLENDVAISLINAEASVTSNTLTGNGTGLEIGASGGEIRDNDISANELGIAFSGTSRLPDLAGNTLCRNGANLRVLGGRSVSLDGNEVCPDEAATTEPRVTGAGPVLAWAGVEIDFVPAHPMGGGGVRFEEGRFIELDEAGHPYESRDGLIWRPSSPSPGTPEARARSSVQPFADGWVIHGDDSTQVDIVHPDGTRTSHTFRGPVDHPVISPAGMLVLEYLSREDVIADVLGPAIADGAWRLVNEYLVDDPDLPDRGDRVTWLIETPEGELRELRLADHGYGGVARGDVRDIATLGWHSVDGVTWEPIRSVPLSYDDQIVGTDEGFWWAAGDDAGSTLWFSADGQDWTRLGSVTGDGRVLPWRDGVAMQDGPNVVAATPTGLRRLPIPDSILPQAWLSAGPLGLLRIDPARGLLRFSSDGEAWSLTDMPVSWSGRSASVSRVAVGDAAVVVRIDRCSDPSMDLSACFDGRDGATLTAELWRGTLAP